jgi:hypothetical protein
VKTNDPTLEFLEISETSVAHFIDVVLETLLLTFLFLKDVSHLLNLTRQTFLSETQVFHYQSKILVDTREVLVLASHFVDLIIEFGYPIIPGPDLAF